MNGEFWPWWLGGLLVGAVATAYPLLSGRLLGVSALYSELFGSRSSAMASASARAHGSELERALLAETEAAFGPAASEPPESDADATLRRWRDDAERFRPLFLVGLVAGGALVRAATQKWQLSWSLGGEFEARYGELGVASVLVLLASGIAIGFGARLGAGCTSGHGISGVARGQPGSVLTTAAFWSTALGVTWLLILAGAAPR